MCPHNSKIRKARGGVHGFDIPAHVMNLDYMMLGAGVGGAVASSFLVKTVGDKIFKDTDTLKKWTPAIKIVGGIAAIVLSENKYVHAAGMGAITVGGVEALQNWKPETFGYTKPVQGLGTLRFDNWATGGSYGDNSVSGTDGFDSGVAGGL